MRNILTLAAVLVLSACAGGPSGNDDVPEPAKPVDLTQYQGLWYEYARYENRFEADCEAVTAEYRPLSDDKIAVKNTCRQGGVDGPVKVSEGKATPAGDPSSAKLKVSFFGPALMTNYWVLDRADDYSWAIVGEGSGRFLWILTREPHPSEALRSQLIARARSLGYDTDMLRYTQQPVR